VRIRTCGVCTNLVSVRARSIGASEIVSSLKSSNGYWKSVNIMLGTVAIMVTCIGSWNRWYKSLQCLRRDQECGGANAVPVSRLPAYGAPMVHGAGDEGCQGGKLMSIRWTAAVYSLFDIILQAMRHAMVRDCTSSGPYE
jgi:hypothetical protein